MLTNNNGKIVRWTLSPFYLLALGTTVQAAELYELQGRHIILASFDTELNKSSIMPAPLSAPTLKPAAKPEQANEKWQRVLRTHPNDTEALAGLSRYYAQSDKPSLARQYLGRLKKANSKHTDIPALERLLGISSPAPVAITPQKAVTSHDIPNAAATHEIAKPAATPPKTPQVAKVNPPLPVLNQASSQPKLAIEKPATPAHSPVPHESQNVLKSPPAPVVKKVEPMPSKPEIKPATVPLPLSVADIARSSIKQGRSDHAVSFLENNKPLDATSTVLYAWALLNTKEDEKLSGLLKEIESEKPIVETRLQAQLTEIRKLHAARQPKQTSRPVEPQSLSVTPTAIAPQIKSAPQPLSTADTARNLIKQSKNIQAVSFLENNKPLDASSTVLYAWALLNTKEDEKLSGLLKEIESEKPIVETRLQVQLTEIRKLHAARQPKQSIKSAGPGPTEKKLSTLNAPPQSSIRLNPLDSAEKPASPVASRQADSAKPGLSQKIFDLKYAAGMTCEAQDYKRCQSMLIELESLGVRDRDILFLRAWNELNLGNHEAAGKRFLSLYQALPDKQSAEGLFYSYSQLNRTEELRKLAREETLSELLKKDQSPAGSTQSAAIASTPIFESDVLAERRANREKYEPFSTLGISHMDMYFSQRSKTGETGTSRVISRREPGLGYGWRSDDKSTDYRIQIDRVKQNPGVLDPAVAIVGTDAAYGGILAPLPQAMGMSGLEPLLIARHDEAGATYTGEIGLTPSGGAVSSTITGRAHALKYTSWGSAGIEAYLQPVRDTMLSYTGMADPYAAFSPWGRVIKTGISPSVYWRINDKWSLTSSALFEGLSGVNTRNNSHYGVKLGVGYSLDVKKFEYLSVDFGGSYDHFQNNQNLFTYGNGGYYSPQSSINIGPSINFLTRNFFPVVIGGRASVGYGMANTTDAVRFPLDPANINNAIAPGGAGFYSSNSKGLNYNFSVQALWNVQKNLQLGCSLAYNQSDASAPSFKESNLSFFARVPFDGIIK